MSEAGRTRAVMNKFHIPRIYDSTSPNIEFVDIEKVNIAEMTNSKKP